MRRIPATEARETLAELCNRVAFAKEAVILTRHGKDLCVLLPMEALERVRQVPATLAEKKSRGRPYLDDTVEDVVAPRSRRRPT